MKISFSDKLSPSPDTLINLVDEESVLLDLKSEQYFGLNDSATQMWSALVETRNIDGACEKLLALYDVDPERLRGDLESFVQKLIERGLVRVDQT
jgi:Coenzyme PQQ synthesis protein D (PqqD)